MKSRKEVIVSFFSFLLDYGIEYSILHHANRVFSPSDDIDFIVDCDVKKMLATIKFFCDKEGLFIVDFFSIDKNNYRFDIVFCLNNKIELLELDCTCKNSGKDFLKIRTEHLLERKIVVECDGSKLFKVSDLDEIEHYIQKKAFKHVEYGNVELEEYFVYLKSLIENFEEKYMYERFDFWVSYYRSIGFKLLYYYRKFVLIFKRLKEKPAFSICFLGPDGSGKSTIIDLLLQSPLFIYKYYFHLKPIPQRNENKRIVADPHEQLNYSAITSYLKLVFFIIQYNLGWLRYIVPLKLKASMIIFDRYYDDLLVDNRRYRYGGRIWVASLVKKMLPRPDIYFLLTADAKIIYERKKEVPYAELERQIESYRLLKDNKRYFNIDVAKSPEEITEEIIRIIIKKAHERY